MPNVDSSQIMINKIIGDIAWETLSIADIDNLDEDPVDRYDRRKIRQALVEAFLAGERWNITKKEQTK